MLDPKCLHKDLSKIYLEVGEVDNRPLKTQKRNMEICRGTVWWRDAVFLSL